MTSDPSEPGRWQDRAHDRLEAEAAHLVHRLTKPVLPDAATLEAVRRRVAGAAAAETIGSRRRYRGGLTWGVVFGALLLGVTVGAAAHSWLTAPAREPPRLAPVEGAGMEAPATSVGRRRSSEPATVPEPSAPAPAAPAVEQAPPASPAPRPRPPVAFARVPTGRPRAIGQGGPEPIAAPATAPLESESQREVAALAAAVRQLRQLGNPRGALAALEEHRARFPAGSLRGEADLIRIEALIALDDRRAALRLLDGLSLDGGPRRRELSVLRGELRAAADRCPEALGDLGSALSPKPADAIDERALLARAACASRRGDHAAARRDLETLRARFPESERAGRAAGAARALPAP